MSNSPENPINVFCGSLCQSATCEPNLINLINFKVNDLEPNVTIGYEKFVSDPQLLPDRILDLLQIAGMVFCADRMARRGERDSISNRSWARSFFFHIPVLDHEFWRDERVQSALSEALRFMTGDRSYEFDFVEANQGHFEEREYQQISVFSEELYKIPDSENYDVMLFSGGLDSLAGILEELIIKKRNVITISHKSNKTVVHTQNQLIDKLNQDYKERVFPYGFSCHNKGRASLEETQRTRMFLFSAIAFSICQCFGKHEFYVYENGVTSLNFSVQTDVINARSSRTTHPKTLGLLQKFYKLFDESFVILAPYYRKTKEDIVKVFQNVDRLDLISSAVSCSSTRNKSSIYSHCGCCSQCIDRRLAIFAADLSEYDTGYGEDFIHEIKEQETSQRLYQQMRFASAEEFRTEFDMRKNYGTETQDVIEYWPNDNPEDGLHEIHDLLLRYSDSVIRAAKRIQSKYEDLRMPICDKSFLKIIADREYLKTPFERRTDEIDEKLKSSLPIMFRNERPKNENDLNDKIVAILTNQNEKWMREYPVIKFGITNYRADGSYDGLIIETKYIRGTTSPSDATEGIAADITKIDAEQSVFFVVYDPERRITDDNTYCQSLMSKKSNCFVKVYR